MRNKYFLTITAVMLFIGLFTVGLCLARLKPLWNDELYSQVFGIEKMSYARILMGQIPEGNNSPMFYVLQKVVCDISRYQLPIRWEKQWGIADPRSQLILRIMPNFFMSLALAAVFYGVAREWSCLAGLYAFLTALACVQTWVYWVEARPYALWLALSVLQLMYMMRFVRNPQNRVTTWHKLCAVHFVLALTAVFGSVQVFIVSVLLFIFYKKNLWQFGLMFFLPLLCGFYYFFHAPHYVFGLPADPSVLIFENIPAERFLMTLLLAAAVMLFRRSSAAPDKTRNEGWGVLGLMTSLLLGATIVIMVCFTMTAQVGWSPFVISSRYFIFLAPVGMIAPAVGLAVLTQVLGDNRWVTLNLWIIACGILVWRVLKTIAAITQLGIY